MNDFDNILKNSLKKDIKKPASYQYAIKNALYDSESKKKVLPLKLVTLAACFVMVCSAVIASPYIADKVWKNPTVSSLEQEEFEINEEISEEEKNSFISSERALEISNDVLKALGYADLQASDVELKRGYDNNYSCHYIIRTGNVLINLNPKSGKLEYFGDSSVINNSLTCDEISESDLKEMANNIYAKLGISTKDTEYEIINVQKTNMVSGANSTVLYEVNFAKVFNDIADKSSVSTICFGVYDGNAVVSSLSAFGESNFENNPVIITKDEAVEVATAKEKDFSDLDISSVSADLSIEKMNVFVYCLENNIANEDGSLKVDDVSRNVWVVRVEHEKSSKPKDADVETVKELYNKKYFVDATTGEIIGGEQAEFWD